MKSLFIVLDTTSRMDKILNMMKNDMGWLNSLLGNYFDLRFVCYGDYTEDRMKMEDVVKMCNFEGLNNIEIGNCGMGGDVREALLSAMVYVNDSCKINDKILIFTDCCCKTNQLFDQYKCNRDNCGGILNLKRDCTFCDRRCDVIQTNECISCPETDIIRNRERNAIRMYNSSETASEIAKQKHDMLFDDWLNHFNNMNVEVHCFKPIKIDDENCKSDVLFGNNIYYHNNSDVVSLVKNVLKTDIEVAEKFAFLDCEEYNSKKMNELVFSNSTNFLKNYTYVADMFEKYYLDKSFDQNKHDNLIFDLIGEVHHESDKEMLLNFFFKINVKSKNADGDRYVFNKSKFQKAFIDNKTLTEVMKFIERVPNTDESRKSKEFNFEYSLCCDLVSDNLKRLYQMILLNMDDYQRHDPFMHFVFISNALRFTKKRVWLKMASEYCQKFSSSAENSIENQKFKSALFGKTSDHVEMIRFLIKSLKYNVRICEKNLKMNTGNGLFIRNVNQFATYVENAHQCRNIFRAMIHHVNFNPDIKTLIHDEIKDNVFEYSDLFNINTELMKKIIDHSENYKSNPEGVFIKFIKENNFNLRKKYKFENDMELIVSEDIKNKFQIIQDLINSNMERQCNVCSRDVNVEKYVKICTNDKCHQLICEKCVKELHHFNFDIQGKIPKNIHRCPFCKSLVNTEHELVGFLRLIIESRICNDDGNHMFIYEKLDQGCELAICSNDSCLDLMELDPEICEVANNEDRDVAKDLLCEECAEAKRRAIKVLAADEALLKKMDEKGFIIDDDGERMRLCPHCNSICVRDGGCAHMTCKQCGTHFAWCCGQSAGVKNNPSKRVYTHLTTVYSDYFPTYEQIDGTNCKAQHKIVIDENPEGDAENNDENLEGDVENNEEDLEDDGDNNDDSDEETDDE